MNGDLDDARTALIEAAIRKHYDDPDGRRILAQRGIQFPEDAGNGEGR